MKTKKLKWHIVDIGAELNCCIDWVADSRGAMMFVEERPPRIEIPRKELWESQPEISYAVSLHELGHVYHKHTQGRPPYESEVFYFENGVLQSEAEAWKFALDNSLVDWAPETKKFALETCLMSYFHSSDPLTTIYLYNGNRHWHNGKYFWDKPTEYFWNVTKELEYETV